MASFYLDAAICWEDWMDAEVYVDVVVREGRRTLGGGMGTR